MRVLLANRPAFSRWLCSVQVLTGCDGKAQPGTRPSWKTGDAPAQRAVVVTSGAAPPAGWREDQQRSAAGDHHWSQVAQCAWPLARDLAPAPLLGGRTASSTGEQTHTQPVVSPEAARRISCEKRWARLKTP